MPKDDDSGAETGKNLPKDIVARLRWSSKELRPFPLDAVENAAKEIERLRAVIQDEIEWLWSIQTWSIQTNRNARARLLEQALKGEK